jgi:hypothetical protein
MTLKQYLKDKNRAAFAIKLGTTLNYLNNLCQRPEQAGKKMIQKIVRHTHGAVSFSDMAGE